MNKFVTIFSTDNIVERLIFIFFICSTLFIPIYHYFHIYFLINIMILIGLLLRFKFEFNLLNKVVLLIGCIYVIGRLYSWIDTSNIFLRDFYELGRFFLAFLVLGLSNFFKSINLKFILCILSIYVISDFIISLLQFIHLDFQNIIYSITKTYSSSYHFSGSYYSNHANGLSSGPGQHGQVIASMYIIFFISYLITVKKTEAYMYLFISLCAIVSLILTQSKTAIIAILIGNILVLIFFIYLKKYMSIKRIIYFYLVIILLLVVLVVLFSDRFYNISNFLEKGFQISSFQTRLNSYEEVLSLASENIKFWLLGYGKVYFGQYGSTMDSDLLYILTVYGLLPSLVFLYCIVKFFIKFFKEKSFLIFKPFTIMLFFTVVIGFIISIPASFFVYPVNLILLCIVLVKAKEELQQETTVLQ